jgi:hypothetical protein
VVELQDDEDGGVGLSSYRARMTVRFWSFWVEMGRILQFISMGLPTHASLGNPIQFSLIQGIQRDLWGHHQLMKGHSISSSSLVCRLHHVSRCLHRMRRSSSPLHQPQRCPSIPAHRLPVAHSRDGNPTTSLRCQPPP